MDYKGTKMTITSGDIAATTTATAAMSMPVWIEYLPHAAAIFVAVLGIPIALLTLGIKYNEWRISQIKRHVAEEEENESDFPVI